MLTGIRCCKGCVPPKRHIGCHSTCPEYSEEREEFDKTKEQIRIGRLETPKITTYDYDEIELSRFKRHKRRFRHR